MKVTNPVTGEDAIQEDRTTMTMKKEEQTLSDRDTEIDIRRPDSAV
jgi:hypothetical protein